MKQKTEDRERKSGICVLGSEKGIALVMVLVLSGIALAIMTGLIYMMTVKTQFSGMQKRFKTALEAGKGGADITYQFIGLRDRVSAKSFVKDLEDAGLYPALTTPETCETLDDDPFCTAIGYFTRADTKLYLPTDCWSGCDDLLTIDPDDETTYDMSFELGRDPADPAYPAYTVYSKIADNAGRGNSGSDADLEAGGVVSSNSQIPTKSVPYLYTVEIDAQNKANPAERAKLSILYQY